MKHDADPLSRARELREAFDNGFREARKPDSEGSEAFLALHLAGTPYVVRLKEVGGLFRVRTITWLPSPVPELLGIAGFRGLPLPVYDLGLMLGAPKLDVPRWLITTTSRPRVAFAFEQFDGHLRNPSPGSLRPSGAVAAHAHGACDALEASGRLWSILSLSRLVEQIRAKVESA